MRSFLFCYCFLQREIFLKAVQPLSLPLTPSGEGVSCLIGGLGRGPGHLWLRFCPSLVFEVRLQIASVLSARSHSANLGLVAWPWAWGLVNNKPVSTVTCSQMTATFSISLVEVNEELGSSLYLILSPSCWKNFSSYFYYHEIMYI